jgi:hypothetical protein
MRRARAMWPTLLALCGMVQILFALVSLSLVASCSPPPPLILMGVALQLTSSSPGIKAPLAASRHATYSEAAAFTLTRLSQASNRFFFHSRQRRCQDAHAARSPAATPDGSAMTGSGYLMQSSGAPAVRWGRLPPLCARKTATLAHTYDGAFDPRLLVLQNPWRRP